MRKLVVTENISIDGVIDAAEGWFDPAADDEVDRSDLIAANNQHMRDSDAVLMGRVTFEEMRGYWPNQTDDETGITEYFNAVDKYVVSSTLTDPEWENSTVLSGELSAEVERLKSEPGKDIVSTGSMTLVAALVAAGLVDEYRLFTYPVVLGRGRRLFEHATSVPDLELADSRSFESGITLSTYAVRSQG